MIATAPDPPVISVSADKGFDRPALETLAEPKGAGVRVLRTDEGRTVEIATDGAPAGCGPYTVIRLGWRASALLTLE